MNKIWPGNFREEYFEMQVTYHQRMFYAKFGWHMWFCRAKFLNLCIFVPYYSGSYLGKWRDPLFKQTLIPIAKDSFVPSYVEICPVYLVKTIFKFCQVSFVISLLSSLWKERGPKLDQTWIHCSQGCFLQSFIEICPFILDKKIF